MAREVITMLDPGRGGVYVDATVGLGGHAKEILMLIGSEGRLIGVDRDEEALKMAKKRLGNDRVILKKGKFSDLKNIAASAGTDEVDGILFDFGVSMIQFKEMERGFSFSSEEPLDMRMDRSQKLTARDIVNTYPKADMERILKEYGEERLAPKIARAITGYRAKKKITSCRELADIVSATYRKRGRQHPATKTFQALRIAVNDEMDEIQKGLEASMSLLRGGGRLCAISYHSLEDRTVKHFMRNAEREGLMRIITKKPLAPSREEVRINPSARSAKLRCGERLL